MFRMLLIHGIKMEIMNQLIKYNKARKDTESRFLRLPNEPASLVNSLITKANPYTGMTSACLSKWQRNLVKKTSAFHPKSKLANTSILFLMNAMMILKGSGLGKICNFNRLSR